MPKRHAIERTNSSERYVVEGNLPFPLDMLRYDSAWPATSQDVTAIEKSFDPMSGKIRVTVFCRHELTAGRWDSFGWKILGHYDDVIL
jgi:hypothetical protein